MSLVNSRRGTFPNEDLPPFEKTSIDKNGSTEMANKKKETSKILNSASDVCAKGTTYKKIIFPAQFQKRSLHGEMGNTKASPVHRRSTQMSNRTQVFFCEDNNRGRELDTCGDNTRESVDMRRSRPGRGQTNCNGGSCDEEPLKRDVRVGDSNGGSAEFVIDLSKNNHAHNFATLLFNGLNSKLNESGKSSIGEEKGDDVRAEVDRKHHLFAKGKRSSKEENSYPSREEEKRSGDTQKGGGRLMRRVSSDRKSMTVFRKNCKRDNPPNERCTYEAKGYIPMSNRDSDQEKYKLRNNSIKKTHKNVCFFNAKRKGHNAYDNIPYDQREVMGKAFGKGTPISLSGCSPSANDVSPPGAIPSTSDVSTPGGNPSASDVSTPGGNPSASDVSTSGGNPSASDVSTPGGNPSASDVSTSGGNPSASDVSTPGGNPSASDVSTSGGNPSASDVSTPGGNPSASDVSTSGGNPSASDVSTPGGNPSASDVSTSGGNPSASDVSTPGGNPSASDVSTSGGNPSASDVSTPGGNPSASDVSTSGGNPSASDVSTPGGNPSASDVSTSGGNSSASDISSPAKTEIYDMPVSSNTRKSFFCNNSLKKSLVKKKSNELKTEILFYKNGPLKGYSNKLDRNRYINMQNLCMPIRTNVFVRTRSLTPYSHFNEKKSKTSPLNNGKISRQKSVPMFPTHIYNKPVCTHEILYTYPVQGGGSDGHYGNDRLGDSGHNGNRCSSRHVTSSSPRAAGRRIMDTTAHAGKKKEKKEGNLSDERAYMDRSYMDRCSTEASSKGFDSDSANNEEMYLLNGKIRRLRDRNYALIRENNSLGELSKMYKNECTRLRELFARSREGWGFSPNAKYVNYEKKNLKLEEENEKLRNQMKVLGKALLSSHDISGIKKVLAKQILCLHEENEKYRKEVKELRKSRDINHHILFNLNRTDISADAVDSIFMQTKNAIIEGHQCINVFYLNLRNLIEDFFQKIKFLIVEGDYTKKEKLLYVASLEEIIWENFDEINNTVVKMNDLRKRMKDVKAYILDTNRSDPCCSCKPARVILEEDINHLEEELHKHSILIKNLRKKNLSLCLKDLHTQFSHVEQIEDHPNDTSKRHLKRGNNINYKKSYQMGYQDDQKNSHQKSSAGIMGFLPNEKPCVFSSRMVIDEFKSDQLESRKREDDVITSITDENASVKLKKEGTTLHYNAAKSDHNNLHEKIKLIEEQLHTLNNNINCSFGDDNEEAEQKEKALQKKGPFLVDKLRKNLHDHSKYFNDSDHEKNCETGKQTYSRAGAQEESLKAEGESSPSPSSCSSSSDESQSAPSESVPSERKKWVNRDEVERSKKKMIELLALLKGKNNEGLVENTKSYVSSFGQYQSQNKQNIRKIYNSLKAIKNNIKNTNDDTEKNILALIESQANEIKMFGNCVDNLKSTMAP
ncbi:conserved Plasmodium protein, unknown function [Plasmodium ovale]|uniref:Uncharacterized protein n=1 Tax=Plasmodium ovale TaxID=36330 RepID=A0A1D3TG78_PLAOA|nr:conserved Plasmodium protein, unknown function [Plasmodium ovale]